MTPTKRKPTPGAFRKGDPRIREWAAKGGRANAARHRKINTPYTGTVLDAMDDAGLTGPTWDAWRTLLRLKRKGRQHVRSAFWENQEPTNERLKDVK